MRKKVLISIDEDVLALIDRRAGALKMTRSKYIAAAVLRLLPSEDDEDIGDDIRDAINGGEIETLQDAVDAGLTKEGHGDD